MFMGLTDEQVVAIEGMIKRAYEEGLFDGRYMYGRNYWDSSLAKNQSCHIIAMKHMKPVEEEI